MMDLDRFWHLIEQARQKIDASQGSQGYPLLSDEDALTEVLATLPPEDIIQFDHRFSERIIAAYHWDLWAALAIIEGGAGDDAFEHFRAELILYGQDAFEAALRDADSLADLGPLPWGMEGLIYVPARVYKAKTALEYPYEDKLDVPPHPDKPAGVPWEDEDLPARLPRLWSKFHDEDDADDLLAPGCLARALACMEAHREVSFTYGIEAFRLADGTLQVHPEHSEHAPWRLSPGRQFIADICRFPRNYVGAPTVVRRTSVQKRIGHYRPSLPYTDDLEMWLRIAAVSDIGYVSGKPGAYYRVHENSMMRTTFKSVFADLEQRRDVFDLVLEQNPGLPARLKPLARKAIAGDALWRAVRLHDRDQLDGTEKRIFSGWMFAESPGLNAVEHPVFDVWLTQCEKPKGAVAQRAPSPEAYGAPDAAAPEELPPDDPSIEPRRRVRR